MDEKIPAAMICGDIDSLIKVHKCLTSSLYSGRDDARREIYDRIRRDLLTLIKLEAADIDPEGEIARVKAARADCTY